MKIMILLRYFLCLGVIVGPLPNPIANGYTMDAVPVMADLNWLVNQVNANAAPLQSPALITPALGTPASGNLINTTGYVAPNTVTGNFYSSTYTPSVSATTNVASSTPHITGYIRLGDFVQVSGYIDITPTAGGVFTTFQLSVPVASNLANAFDLGGAGVSDDGTNLVYAAATIQGFVANKTAKFNIFPASTALQSLSFSFGYQVK